MKIEAIHDFHDAEYAQEWSDRFEPTPARQRLFDMMTDVLSEDLDSDICIVELGTGPGYLASHILAKLTQVEYECVDFSAHMLSIAEERLSSFIGPVHFTQADLTAGDWTDALSLKPTAVVTTWALHDLLSKESIARVYDMVYRVIPSGGIFLNGDFIKPEESTVAYEAGRIKPSTHLELLRQSGFREATCLGHFEVDVEHPTTSNNYACFKAVR